MIGAGLSRAVRPPVAELAMRSGNPETFGDASDASLPLSVLAEQVLRSITVREAPKPAPPCARRVDVLMDAVLTPAAFAASDVVERLLASGLSQRAIADVYVPAVARRLGDCWSGNEMSFTRVTIASGRLQEMLGHLAEANDRPVVADRTKPRVALLTLADDQHTLGWKLLTVQLRRQGVTVFAIPGATPGDAVQLVERGRCHLVLVSASRLAVLGRIAEIASGLRARQVNVPPIVLGGLVAEQVPGSTSLPDVACITNDLGVALSHIRLHYRADRDGPE